MHSQRGCTTANQQTIAFRIRGTYPIRKHTQTLMDGNAARLGHAVPHIWFLRDSTLLVVVPEERSECSCLHPPITKLLVGVPVESTAVSSNHWHLEELELEHALDHVMEVCPLAEIIAKLQDALA